MMNFILRIVLSMIFTISGAMLLLYAVNGTDAPTTCITTEEYKALINKE